VFEGASAEVAGFLSVASKAAAVALLARLVLSLGGLGEMTLRDGMATVPAEKMANLLIPILAVVGIVTATFGNLAAFRQTNLKRLLAYSTIAHAGYMIMALATLDRAGVSAVLVYLAAYVVMNLGAFAVIAFLRNMIGSEELADYRGLVRRAPGMTVALSIFLLSLLGLPPLIGFLAKLRIFMVLWDGATLHSGGLAFVLFAALAFLALNSVLGAVYYLKVMKVMIIEQRVEDVENRPAAPTREPAAARDYAFVLALVVFVGIFAWATVENAAKRSVAVMETAPTKEMAKR
jgi:NADH-quinone oxidoreductase subunit N